MCSEDSFWTRWSIVRSNKAQDKRQLGLQTQKASSEAEYILEFVALLFWSLSSKQGRCFNSQTMEANLWLFPDQSYWLKYFSNLLNVHNFRSPNAYFSVVISPEKHFYKCPLSMATYWELQNRLHVQSLPLTMTHSTKGLHKHCLI